MDCHGIFPYIYQQNWTIHVGEYTVRPMDGMGIPGPF